MSKLVVEIGMPLEGGVEKYKKMLRKYGLKCVYSCVTHDLYYTKDSLDGLSENEMKNACKRLRMSKKIGRFAFLCKKLLLKKQQNSEVTKQEQLLVESGYKKVFDTIKIDWQFAKEGMKSRVQLQEIDGVGLLVYYDNPDYYDRSEDEQRKLLIDELDGFGFSFKHSDLGLDKLRTLYYGKKMYSKNQNG